MYIGKHYFHLKEYSILQLICRHITIQMEMELQAYLVQFFLMRWEIKKIKYGK